MILDLVIKWDVTSQTSPQKGHDEKSRIKEFKLNDTVLVRSYRKDGDMWMTGTVVSIKMVQCPS